MRGILGSSRAGVRCIGKRRRGLYIDVLDIVFDLCIANGMGNLNYVSGILDFCCSR